MSNGEGEGDANGSETSPADPISEKEINAKDLSLIRDIMEHSAPYVQGTPLEEPLTLFCYPSEDNVDPNNVADIRRRIFNLFDIDVATIQPILERNLNAEEIVDFETGRNQFGFSIDPFAISSPPLYTIARSIEIKHYKIPGSNLGVEEAIISPNPEKNIVGGFAIRLVPADPLGSNPPTDAA